MNLQIDLTQVVVADFVEENAPNIHRTFVLIIIEFEHMIIINKAYICAYVHIYNILYLVGCILVKMFRYVYMNLFD